MVCVYLTDPRERRLVTRWPALQPTPFDRMLAEYEKPGLPKPDLGPATFHELWPAAVYRYAHQANSPPAARHRDMVIPFLREFSWWVPTASPGNRKSRRSGEQISPGNIMYRTNSRRRATGFARYWEDVNGGERRTNPSRQTAERVGTWNMRTARQGRARHRRGDKIRRTESGRRNSSPPRGSPSVA